MRGFKFRFFDKQLKELFYRKPLTYDFSVDDIIPMQYTGLKDKNGVEIYEGDIINIAGNHRKIYFEHGCFWVEYNGELHLHVFGEKLQYEIIGNIYENKELLEVV